MRCAICRNGETKPGTTTVTLERGGNVVIIKGVPAEICANCGEAYVDEGVSSKVMSEAESALTTGVELQVKQYVTA